MSLISHRAKMKEVEELSRVERSLQDVNMEAEREIVKIKHNLKEVSCCNRTKQWHYNIESM